jgi:hypothetical protein
MRRVGSRVCATGGLLLLQGLRGDDGFPLATGDIFVVKLGSANREADKA